MSVILGTAGHIDHGKTALVRALTGVDTDRLKEEKARGITIELGFAEMTLPDGTHCGVVDVPGHEAFVRAMVAGAAGMDLVLLVIAADEGVMPQTREHLAIVQLLGVPELVVALSKCDAVEDEWLELVDSDVADTLAATPYADAPRIATSAQEGTGLDDLREALVGAAERARTASATDLTRLPLDRVFTIQGTGTVATGSMWSGSLEVGARVRILPGDHAARIRSLEVHGRTTERAEAGDRTAVALTGEGGDRDQVGRGATLVDSPHWEESWMLTSRVGLLEDTAWTLEHNQRVHVHLGTAEVLARCALLEEDGLVAGQQGWVQLRLEAPLVARAGDRFVVRSYSPVTTIGGGVVAEPTPPKRNRLDDATRAALGRVLDGDPERQVEAALDVAGWAGIPTGRLAIQTSLAPSALDSVLPAVTGRGALVAGDFVVASSVAADAEARILAAVGAAHEADSLREEAPLAAVRQAIPGWAPPELANAVLARLVADGRLVEVEGGVRLPDFQPTPTPDQEAASDALMALLTSDGLAAPFVDEIPDDLRGRPDFKSLLRRLEKRDDVRAVADGLYVASSELDAATTRIRSTLAGRTGLAPADFRDALPVTRKHLIPLLTYFDGVGTTRRHPDGRDVPEGGAGD